MALWGGYVGGNPLHGTGPGVFPRPSGAATDGVTSTAEVGHNLGVHLGGGGERGGGFRTDGNLHSTNAECGHAVYCDATNSRPVRGGGEEEGGMGRDAVVGTGGNLLSRGKGEGGGGRGGGRIWAGGLKEGD